MMSHKPITVAVAAAAIADQAGGGAAEPKIGRQIRTFIQQDLIKPALYTGAGPTAAALLAPTDVCRARILFGLATMLGTDVRMLARLCKWMEIYDFDSVVHSINSGGSPLWDFVVVIRRNTLTSQLEYNGAFVERDAPIASHEYHSMSDFPDDDGGLLVAEARFIIPATKVLAPVLAWLVTNGYA